MEALKNIVYSNNNSVQKDIPDETVCQIVLAMLKRISLTLTNGMYEIAVKQFD